MGRRAGGRENIWLTWDGEDQAVLGYFTSKGEKLVKHCKCAVVLCHAKPANLDDGVRSGGVVDAFKIRPDTGFIRTLKLPRETHTIELLIEDDDSAWPLKTFKLARGSEEQQAEPRYGNLVIALPENDGDDTDGRFVWSEKRIHHVNVPDGNIGWAGYYKCWPVDGTDESENIVMVSSFRLEVPHLEDTMLIFPAGYDILEADTSGKDDNATAIMRACVENDRTQNAVLTIEGSPPLLHGLYFLHVSAHRKRANEWTKFVDIDPGIFQMISDNLVDAYRQQLSDSGDWSDNDIENAGHNLIDLLTQEHRWFELTSPDYFVDVVPQQTDEKVEMSVFEISAGDHLVFYDTLGRKLRAGKYFSPDSILAFEVNTNDLKLLRGVYAADHKLIAEIDAQRPAKRASSLENTEVDTLPPSLRMKHDQIGAPYTPFGFLPLKVHSAIDLELNASTDEFPWGSYVKDPAPWLLANSIMPNFWKSMRGIRHTRGNDLLVRTLALLGREKAFEKLEQLEEQIIALFSVTNLAGATALRTCVFRIDGINPAEDDFYTMADCVNRIDDHLSNPEFRDWLHANNPQMHDSLLGINHTFKPIERDNLEIYSEDIALAMQTFEAFHSELKNSRNSNEEVERDDSSWQSLGASEEALDALITSLLESKFARDEMAGRHYQSVLEKFGSNPYYRSRIASDIYTNYPNLQPNDGKQLIEILRGLLTDAGCNFDARNFDERIVDSVAESMSQGADVWLLPNAVQMQKMAMVELENVSLTTPTDDIKKSAIISFASAHEMQRTWDDITELDKRAKEKGVKVPAKLRRLKALWPQESSTTLIEYMAFEQSHRHVLGQSLHEKYGYDSALHA